MDQDISSSIKFRDICKMFEQMKSQKNTQRKELVLKRYHESFSRHRLAFRQQMGLTADQPEEGASSFYAVLRLLLPGADTRRDNYGLQITALGRLYTRVLQLAKDSTDAIRLQHRSWSFSRGDYADVVHAVLLPRCHNQPSDLTLEQIHHMLDIIANEDTTVKEQEIIKFTEQASPMEQKWLIRILLKRLELGIGEQRIFGVLHPHAKDIYQRCSDLLRVCNLLADNKLSLEQASGSRDGSVVAPQPNLNFVIEPFHQIRPMLCERFPGKIEELMESDVLYMEVKMDGERFQLHYARGRFKYISRNGADYTRNFGESYEQGTLTPQLRSLLPLGMESIILDGEMMVWDTNQLRYRDKGENTDVKHLKPERSWQPCYVIYDLLYLNGQSLLDMPYVQRTHKLKELVVERPGVLQLMRPRKIGTLKEFHDGFQQALDSNAEGIVLKKQNSTYRPGVRVGGGWYKDKADYIKGLTTEFDVLIIGGFYNRKLTFIESFLLGVLQTNTDDSGSGRDQVYSIGRVANNTRQRAVLNDALKPHWHKASSEPPPLWYHYKAGEKEGCPDVWIEPRHSIILQVKAADLAPYGAFFTAKALHFPRTELVRDDKVWDECMTLQEFNQLCEGRAGIKKLNKRQLCLDDFTTERKRQKLTPAERSRMGLAAYEKRHTLEPNSKLFDDFRFCILSGAPSRRQSKQQLRDLALQNGGSIVENPLPHDSKCICIAGDITFMVERLMQQNSRNCEIVRMDWLLRSCQRQQIDLRPKDVLAATEPLRVQFAKSFDNLGDSYTEPFANIQELQEVLDDITEAELNAVQIETRQLLALEQKLLCSEKPYNIFQQMRGFFYPNSKVDDLARIYFLQHGGQLVNELDPELTHAFVQLVGSVADAEVQEWLQSEHLRHVEILNSAWLYQCHREEILLPSSGFRVNT